MSLLTLDAARAQLAAAGYAKARTTGGHEIWTRPGVRPAVLVHHGTRDRLSHLNRRAVRQALRQGGQK